MPILVKQKYIMNSSNSKRKININHTLLKNKPFAFTNNQNCGNIIILADVAQG